MPRSKKRGTEIEQRDRPNEDTIRYMNQQVDSIDRLIADLLHDIDFDELKCKERIDLVIKLMSQQARVLVLRQSCTHEKSGTQDERFVAALMSKMRGERQESDDNDNSDDDEDNMEGE